MLIIFGLVDGGIFYSCGKVGCHIKILLDVYAWLYEHGFNISRIKISGVFWGYCWNIFESLDSCWVLMHMFYMIILEGSWGGWFGTLQSCVLWQNQCVQHVI